MLCFYLSTSRSIALTLRHLIQKWIRSSGTSLVVQWLRLCLPMQWVQVQPTLGQGIPHDLHPKKHKTENGNNTASNSIKNKQVLNTIQIKEAILVSSKGLQLDKQKTFSPTPLPAFTYKNKSFFNKVRFNKDTKRETFAWLILEHKGHLWLYGDALYILIMYTKKGKFFNNTAQGCKGSGPLKNFKRLA